MTRTVSRGFGLSFVALVVIAPLALGHPEHPTLFPTVAQAKTAHVPRYRTRGKFVVVCQSDSGRRIRRIFKGRRHAKQRKRQLKMFRHCRFHSIQTAVNHSRSGYRIEILPGVYKEPKSRKVPVGGYHQPPCDNDYVETEGFTNTAPPPVGPTSNDPPVRPDRNYMVDCPNSKYLIVVNGDPRHEPNPPHPANAPACLRLCNLQIEGTGRKPTDVVIVGDRKKVDVIRVDRANGIYLRNFTVEQGWFNDVDIVEVNGFVVKDLVTRYGQDYGILSFTAVNGLYDHDVAYGNGDSGLYPGSTMKGCDVPDPNSYGQCSDTGKPNAEGLPGRPGCQRYSIEIRNSESYGNTLGYSGTAGNSTWVHDNKFHDNASGMATDSLVPGHPGFPQECAKWERNRIYSNNNNIFNDANQTYCTEKPFEQRHREVVCPEFAAPVGTGLAIASGDRNLVRNNYIYDNWRYGVALVDGPATLRGDNDPSHQFDNGNGNQFIDNYMGHTPDGARHPNGLDFEWAGTQGVHNCWSGNQTSGPGHESDPTTLPGCPDGNPVPQVTNKPGLVQLVACFAWDPIHQHMPAGCDWFVTPPKPQ